MAAGEPEDLASVASRAEERLALLEAAVLKEREELRAKVAELEVETEKLRYRVQRLGCSLKEQSAAARAALQEVKSDRGLRSRLGAILFGKYYLEKEEGEE